MTLKQLPGVQAPDGSNYVTLTDGSGNIGSQSIAVGASFTRPADTTAYTSGDLIANNTTAGSVVPMTFTCASANDRGFWVVRARLKKTNTSVTNASFRLHLYKDTPTVSNGDNGAWLSNEQAYLGAMDITADKTFTDYSKGIGTPNNGTVIIATPTSGTQTIFGLLEARAAYTPTSAEVFSIVLEISQD